MFVIAALGGSLVVKSQLGRLFFFLCAAMYSSKERHVSCLCLFVCESVVAPPPAVDRFTCARLHSIQLLEVRTASSIYISSPGPNNEDSELFVPVNIYFFLAYE